MSENFNYFYTRYNIQIVSINLIPTAKISEIRYAIQNLPTVFLIYYSKNKVLIRLFTKNVR